MTPDEILAMQPGREMDALVAEVVMGWKRVLTPKGTWRGRFIRGPGNYVSPGPDGGWHPSGDIAAAWEVMDHVMALDKLYAHANWRVAIHGPGSYDDEGNACGDPTTAPWEVVLGRPSLPNGWAQIRTGEGRKLPEAICKAALLAKTEGDA